MMSKKEKAIEVLTEAIRNRPVCGYRYGPNYFDEDRRAAELCIKALTAAGFEIAEAPRHRRG